MNMTKCTQADMDEFYEVGHTVQRMFEKEALYCIQPVDINHDSVSFNLTGISHAEEHRRLELAYVPCFTYHRKTQLNNLPFDSCESNEKKTMEYLKQPELIIVYNTERYDEARKGNELVKETKLVRKDFDLRVPTRMQATL